MDHRSHSRETFQARKTLKTVAPLLAASVLLSGCADAKGSHDTYRQPKYQGSEQSHPLNPCGAEFSLYNSPEEELAYAKNCLATYVHADVALVTYDMSATRADKLTTDMEKRFNKVTDGIISIDITPVPASATAEKKFDASSPTCLEDDKVDEWGSTIAEKAMPELKKYDYIMAETDLESCSGTVAGIANTDSRDLQIFNADELSVPVKTSGDQKGLQPMDFSSVAMHELLHLYGLGHSGSMYGDRGNLFPYGVKYQKTYTSDVIKYFTTATYNEYDQNFNVMGGMMPDSPAIVRRAETLDKIQLDRLRKTRYAAEQIDDPNEQKLEDGPVIVTADFKESTILTYQLPDVTYVSGKSPAGEVHDAVVPVTRLIFKPYVYHGSHKSLYDISVFAASSDNGLTLINLGDMYQYEPDKPNIYKMKVFNDVVTVTFNKGQAVITLDKGKALDKPVVTGK